MRRLLVVLVAALATGCGPGGVEEATPAPVTTTSAPAPETTPTTRPVRPFPPDFLGTVPLPPDFLGTGDVVNVHSPVLFPRPGQTSWEHTSINGVTITLRIDTATPTANVPVTLELGVSSPTLACCGLELRPGDGATLTEGGGLACLPPEAAGNRVATFRRTHVYATRGQFSLSVLVRAGTCPEASAFAGFSTVITVA
jgi:hypothetical protein